MKSAALLLSILLPFAAASVFANTADAHIRTGLAAGRTTEARAAFTRGLELPSTGKHDEAAKFRARAALQRLE